MISRYKTLMGRALRAYGRINSIARSALEDASASLENRFLTGQSRNRLIILDDIFPHLLSAFRIAEYNAYLQAFERAEVHSTASAFRHVREKRTFAEVVDEYEQHYPQFAGKVFKLNRKRNLQCKLMYTVFVSNAFSFIDIAEQYDVPFIFTLYPGGGFALHWDTSDTKLRRVCSSPSFKKVIVTQKVTYEYLLDKQFCSPDKVEFIYGGVLPTDQLARQIVAKKYYKRDKDTFDICFVAPKYMERGVDKGYDVFVEVARLLSNTHRDIYFHVVGPYDGTDIDVNDMRSKIRFYGFRHTDFFPEFYSYMDIILSPNIPFVLRAGSFDGFPTGACAEAGLSGVAVFCTDILGQNVAFKNDEEIAIIPPEAEEICGMINRYYDSYDDLCELGMKGQEAFGRVFDVEVQMKPRLRILHEWLSSD